MKSLILVMSMILLTACGKKSSDWAWVNSAPFIQKEGMLFPNRMEGTPFVWGGELHYLISNRMVGSSIEIYKGTNLISSVNTDIHMLSGLVHGGELIVVGSVDSFGKLQMIKTADLNNWSAPVDVLLPPPGMQVLNTSISVDDQGFILAYETCEPNTKCFNARFLRSTDLVNWTPVGSIFKPQIYAACPTIRFVDGYYYVFYLKHVGHFATYVSRSTDLVNWEDSPITVLSALDDPAEDRNNSDFDLVELNGKVHMQYADGDQLTWTNIRSASYQGTLKQFVEEFF